jgi:hypothetical protein
MVSAEAFVIRASWSVQIISASRRAYIRTRKLFGL